MIRSDANQKENIICMSTNKECDVLYSVTKSGQVIYSRFDLCTDQKNIEIDFNYVMCAFHRNIVTGLDTCLRKQLIATCSKDKTVRIWNYDTRKQETKVCDMGDECLAIAFHPSGFHVLVALPDKINICTILSREIKIKASPLPIKGCTEIQFSHGGHLFAVAAGTMTKEIHIYNFFTNECAKTM